MIDELVLRPLNEKDIELLFKWRNDPETISNSLSLNGVDLDEHLRWFKIGLEDGDKKILIGEYQERPVGMVRLDWLEDGGAEVSINLDPSMRGLGFGKQLLQQALLQFPKVRMFATIRGENIASLMIFLSSGFRLMEYNSISKLIYLSKEPK